MIQPCWILPLLAIAGLGIRDIMGYCVVAFGKTKSGTKVGSAQYPRVTEKVLSYRGGKT